MKRFFKIIGAIAGVIVLLIAAVVIAVNTSPRPVAWLTNWQFSDGIGDPNVFPPVYHELSEKVKIEKDIEYPSKFTSNRLDIYSPIDDNGPVPTILWIHGGGYVGGDKSDIGKWATIVSAEGYTVISINYALAPDVHYPTPLIQTGEAYEFIKQNPGRFPAADIHRLIIGGDSAGAQLASQFIALQTNPELAGSMQIKPVVPREDLHGVILYCGPYDLRGLHDSGTWLGQFFVRQMGWSYFGVRNWRDISQAAQASTPGNVTAAYPPTFITDGNVASFEPDAKKLELALKEKGVYVDSLYYPIEHGKLGHEYQFDYSLPESMEAYRRTLAFLKKITTGN